MPEISNRENDRPDPNETFLRLWMQHEPELRAFVRCGSFRRLMIMPRSVLGRVLLPVTNCFPPGGVLPGIAWCLPKT